jgi:type I restriction enzyme S subunit
MIFPASHDLLRLKWAFASTKNGAWGDEPDGLNDVICIRAADFDSDLGRLTDAPRTVRSIDPGTFRKVSLRSGDLIVEKSGGGEKQLVGRAVVYEGLEPAVCSNFLARCRPSSRANPKFLNYLMLAIYNGRGTYPHIKQTTGIQNLDLSSFLNIEVKLPAISLQERIAAFLDEKTAQIDALVEKKEQLLERLAEKRQATITQAVTKGLNPAAPMKDSGIDWLGRIPAHWDVKRLRFVVRLHSGATPTTGATEYWDGDLNWISPKDMKRDSITETIDKVTELAVDEYGLTCFSETNVVIVVRGMILAKTVPVAIAPGRYTINQDMKALVANGKIDPEYLQMYLSAIRSFLMTLIAEAGHGTKALRTDVLVDTPTLIPPISEQETIAVKVQQQKDDLDRLSDCISKAVARLTEYRAALIAAAVTGQIEELR